MGCHFLFQGIVPSQEPNLRLLHCRQILYHRASLVSSRCLLGNASSFNITQAGREAGLGRGRREGAVETGKSLLLLPGTSEATAGCRVFPCCAFHVASSIFGNRSAHKDHSLGWVTLQIPPSLKRLSASPRQHRWTVVLPCWAVWMASLWMASLHVRSWAQKLLFLCPDKLKYLENTVNINIIAKWLLIKGNEV